MGSSGKSKGPSQMEIYQTQVKAEKEERERIRKSEAKAREAANASRSAGAGESGGEGTTYEGGALSGKKKRGATLAGEGEQTFGSGSTLGG